MAVVAGALRALKLSASASLDSLDTQLALHRSVHRCCAFILRFNSLVAKRSTAWARASADRCALLRAGRTSGASPTQTRQRLTTSTKPGEGVPDAPGSRHCRSPNAHTPGE